MPSTSRCLVIAVLAATLPALPALAADNDDFNFQGDKLSFPVNITGKVKGSDKDVCIPAATPLRGMGLKPPNADKDNYEGVWVRLGNVFGAPKDCTDPDGKALVPDNTAILIAKADFEATRPGRYGLTYGGLVVPFKYHVNGSKEFRGGSTVAPYLGYRFDSNSGGYGAKLVGFIGASTVAVAQNVDGEERTQSLAGFSYGVAVIGQIKGDFQMGLAAGVDRVSKSANYVDNGKWWVAVSLGFNFAQ